LFFDMEPLRLGFIGAGVMAQFSIFPSLYFAPIQLQAVCDLDEERVRQVAGKFGTNRWYTDYRQMWAEEDLEAVIIHMHPTPRQAIVRDALEAGYHVFIPKPPANTLAETQELADLAAQVGKSVMVNFQRRFSFGVRQAREIMGRTDFGRLTQLSCSFCSGLYGGARGRDYEDQIHALLLDFMPHHLDLARYIGGEIGRLSLFHNIVGNGVAVALAVEYESGAVGTMQFNSQRIWWRNYDRLEITGQGQYVVVDGLWGVKHYTEAGNSFTENYSDQRSIELTGDAYALVEFVEAIRENREPVASIQDAVGTMRLYQAIYDAVQSGRHGLLPLDAY
jgi:predicted dehydrogenase